MSHGRLKAYGMPPSYGPMRQVRYPATAVGGHARMRPLFPGPCANRWRSRPQAVRVAGCPAGRADRRLARPESTAPPPIMTSRRLRPTVPQRRVEVLLPRCHRGSCSPVQARRFGAVERAFLGAEHSPRAVAERTGQGQPAAMREDSWCAGGGVRRSALGPARAGDLPGGEDHRDRM
jgi:hypothetical protein